ncbi:hypothetical protein [Winogradskyella sp. Asnod2-B02-A]|uniref:hypothetical protein n=1 Tax=Winogradskyella sp. Asnod2-B02-A TaxID=3160583 RepID=UPI00386C87E0
MKNVRLLLVLLLIVNCTTDLTDDNNISEIPTPETLSCVDDLPQIRITNNGVHSFDFLIYDLEDDYNTLYDQNISVSLDSDWIEMPSNSIVIIASNEYDYGQKIEVNLENCDAIEVVIDANDDLTFL